MNWLLLLKVVLLVFLSDLENTACFKRKRNGDNGNDWFCINSIRYSFKFLGHEWDIDGWHTVKMILMGWLIADLVRYDQVLTLIGWALNFILHEKIFYHGIFNKLRNN